MVDSRQLAEGDVAPEDPAPGPSHEKKPSAAGSAPGATSGEHEAGGGLGLSGKVLADRYRVESRLGQGGMASVYRASDTRLNRVVVVKVPHAALLVDPGFRKRFAAEVNNSRSSSIRTSSPSTTSASRTASRSQSCSFCAAAT